MLKDVESNSKRWLGDCSESNLVDYHHFETLKTKRVSIIDRFLSGWPLRSVVWEAQSVPLGVEPSTRL